MILRVENNIVESNYITKNILECVDYWNRSHEKIRAKNITGELGDKETNNYARATEYADWLNEMILIDCKTFCESERGKELNFECGRTHSHVWVHQNGERVLMIYANNQ